MNERKKIALFDFCETIVSFQTADLFVDYIREKHNHPRMDRWELFRKFLQKKGYIKLIEKVFNLNYSVNKRLKLYQLKGIDSSDIIKYAAGYYKDCIKPALIGAVIDEIKRKKEEGYQLYIVSGGYDVYIKFFVMDYHLDGMITSRLLFKNAVCKGRMEGPDCMGINKVILLNDFFKNMNVFSVAYSDSISDLPLLKWADEGYVVKRKGLREDWVINNNLKVLQWEQ